MRSSNNGGCGVVKEIMKIIKIDKGKKVNKNVNLKIC